MLALIKLCSLPRNGHPSTRHFETDWKNPLPEVGTYVVLGPNIKQGVWTDVYVKDGKLHLTVQTEGTIDHFNPPDSFREVDG